MYVYLYCSDCLNLIWFQSAVQTELVQIQPNFKGSLLDAVEIFKEDSNLFTNEYETVRWLFLFATCHFSSLKWSSGNSEFWS